MNLWDLKVNDSCVVDSLNCSDQKSSSLLTELGLSKDCSVKCLYKTIWGGPRVFEINGSAVFSICSQGAKQVSIKKI